MRIAIKATQQAYSRMAKEHPFVHFSKDLESTPVVAVAFAVWRISCAVKNDGTLVCIGAIPHKECGEKKAWG